MKCFITLQPAMRPKPLGLFGHLKRRSKDSLLKSCHSVWKQVSMVSLFCLLCTSLCANKRHQLKALSYSKDRLKSIQNPYTKPGDKLCYVDTRSNHPPSVFKAIPRGVAQRIATNSSSKREFEAAKGPFLKALREAHHAEEDLKEAWDYANYVDPPTVNPQTNEVEEGGAQFLKSGKQFW